MTDLPVSEASFQILDLEISVFKSTFHSFILFLSLMIIKGHKQAVVISVLLRI